MKINQNFTQKPNRYTGEIRKKDFYDQYLDKIKKNKIKTVLELGCATGDFLYHLPLDVKGVGVDVSSHLIDIAKQTRDKENLEYICEDFFKYKPKIKPDLVVMTGFMCTFLDFEKVLEYAISLTGEHIFINDFINENELDCKHSFKEVGDSDFQTVYNIWSRRTLTQFFKSKNIDFVIEPYNMASTLRESTNPTYNYHASLNNKRVLINNGGVILNGCNIFIKVKK